MDISGNTSNFARTLMQLLSQPDPNTATNAQVLDIARLVTATHSEYLSNMNTLVQLMDHQTRHHDMTIDISTLFGGLRQPGFASTNVESGLSEADIRRYTTTSSFAPSENLISTICPITLDAFREGDSITKIQTCGHIFKTSAITEWLRRHERCPVCRARVHS